MDTRVVNCPRFNQQKINFTRQLSCHRREYLFDYDRHQDRNGITIVEGVVFRSAPEHKIRTANMQSFLHRMTRDTVQQKFCTDFFRSRYERSRMKVVMRSAILWDFTRPRMAVSCRRFGTTYRSQLRGSSSPRRTLRMGSTFSSRNVGKKLPF